MMNKAFSNKFFALFFLLLTQSTSIFASISGARLVTRVMIPAAVVVNFSRMIMQDYQREVKNNDLATKQNQSEKFKNSVRIFGRAVAKTTATHLRVCGTFLQDASKVITTTLEGARPVVTFEKPSEAQSAPVAPVKTELEQVTDAQKPALGGSSEIEA